MSAGSSARTRPEGERARWAGRVAAAFGVWLAVALAAWFLGNRPHPGLLALLVGLAAAVVWLFLDVSADTEPVRWPEVAEEPVHPPGEDKRLTRLHRVVSHHQDAREVGDALHRQLAHLADQRLVAHHGVSHLADPERAAALLGPELAAVMDQRPPYPRLPLRQIDDLLKRIEAL